jgi:two-component system sensor histidine kinase KdpD
MHELATDAHALSSALLASISHDLRNPLSVIRGAAEVLQAGFPHLEDEDHHAYLRAIRRECLRMDEYIQGLFHLTRLLVGGTARLVRDWIGIDELLGSAVERLLRYRDGARVTFDVATPLKPVHVHGALIEQALFNVLDNAAKFSPLDAPVLVRVSQDDAANTDIEIRDVGPGIPADQRERIFGMFVSHDPQARGRAGAGLGLAISRSILRAHGGNVVADDVHPQGTCMRITLPAQEENAGRIAP